MCSTSFDNYAWIGRLQEADNTKMSVVRRVIGTVTEKLTLDRDDYLREIGYSQGNFLLPLSYQAARFAGIDNPAARGRLSACCGSSIHIKIHHGNFLSMVLPGTLFSKVLVYSVLQYVTSQASVIQFMCRALSVLRSGGQLLLGDLPNLGKTPRFTSTIA